MAETEIEELKQRISVLEQSPNFRAHQHTGTDSIKVIYSDLDKKKLWVHHTIQGTAAATLTNYGVFWIAPVACFVTKFQEVHQTAGSDGSAVTLTLEKLTGTTAPDSGTVLLTTALSLKATANTVQTGTLVTTIASYSMNAGDRLCLKDAGTLTAVDNVTVLTEITIV